jgi:spiro-SPASM protein
LGEKCALDGALERVRAFPGCEKAALFAGAGFDALAAAAGWRCPAGVEVVSTPVWTRKNFLERLSSLSAGFDLTFFCWADAPFLDPALAGALAERHVRYAAEYSYADGWPYGFAPELLAPGVAGILAKISGDDAGPVGRETLFQVIEKDINAFDIETEISPVDLRQYRLSFTADSKRNTLLVTRFAEAGFGGAADAERFVSERPDLLRTLPAFYGIQTSGACPQECALCPYPAVRRHAGAAAGDAALDGGAGGFIDPARFESLLDRIAAFSGDAVIDLSLWGEFSLHPRKLDLIDMVLARPDLSLIIETSGLGWSTAELEVIAGKAAAAFRPPLPWTAPAGRLSWVVSLDAATEARYAAVRGAGFGRAVETATALIRLFPRDAFVQALRVEGAEDDIEQFYRFWKETAGTEQVIIQKYDDFAGALPRKQAADLSPIERRPCWHLLRDMSVFMDGRVPRCREDVAALTDGAARDVAHRIMGNVFEEPLETIWGRGMEWYRGHCSRTYPEMCAGCDEYYTFNF